MSWKKVVGRPHKKRDVWWEKQRLEGMRAKANITAEPGTTAWAFMYGPDIVDNARINHPEWFGLKPPPKDPSQL